MKNVGKYQVWSAMLETKIHEKAMKEVSKTIVKVFEAFVGSSTAEPPSSPMTNTG